MSRFKLPLIVTAIAIVVGLIGGLIIVTMVHNSKLSSRQKNERVAMLGTGMATAVCVVVAPFWFVTAARIGKERRASRNAGKGRM